MFYGGIIIRVLIIEDDIITRTIQKGIVLEIASKVFEASDFFGGIDIIKKSNIDLVILDIGLNGEKDGIDFLKELRKQKNTYVIVISQSNRVCEAYDMGADDYLRKPFDPKELKRKIQVFTKRFKICSKVIDFDGCIYLDDDKKTVFVHGEEVEIGNKEYDFLYLMILNKGVALHKDFIHLKIWGETDEMSRKLDVLVSRVKKKIPYLKDKIVQKPKFGYILK